MFLPLNTCTSEAFQGSSEEEQGQQELENGLVQTGAIEGRFS